MDRYLRQLRRWLGNGPHAQRVCEEVREHLLDASDARQRQGVPPADAEREAVLRFGEPASVAWMFCKQAPAVAVERIESFLLLGSAALSLTFAGLIIAFGTPSRLVRGEFLEAWGYAAAESLLGWVAVAIGLALLRPRAWIVNVAHRAAPFAFLLGVTGVALATFFGHRTGDYEYWLYLAHGNVLAQGVLAYHRFRPIGDRTTMDSA